MKIPTGHVPDRDPSLIFIGDEPPNMNAKARRARRRELARAVRPITLADVPPGSLLSDATIEAIARGDFGISRPPGTPTPGGKIARWIRRNQVFRGRG